MASDFLFSCSNETQPRIVELIREHRLNRLVVAACSPKTHESLFQNTLRRAGLNPYLLEMVNIRNQCAWVHPQAPEEATQKALEMTRAAVHRAAGLEPLYDHVYPVVQRGLVIGGGLAGMTSALAIADQGFPVILIERDSRLGGNAHLLTETLEGDSPAELYRTLQERLLNPPLIDVRLEARLVRHSGRAGDFPGEVVQGDRREAIRYGAVIVSTGGRPYRPEEYCYGQDPRVCTQLELSRLLSEDPGAAKGLHRVVMIQCVGSRKANFPSCSRVCCAAAVKNSLRIKMLHPEALVIVLFRDLRTFGFMELFYLKARKAGVLFFRFVSEEGPDVYLKEGKLIVDFTDRNTRENFRVEPDLLVLSSGIRPSVGSEEIARLLKVPQTQEGFFLEAHSKLRPLAFAQTGIFLAGLAHSPRFIKDSLLTAKGAAGQALQLLSRTELSTPALAAVVNTKRCRACLVCVRICPFHVPFINASGVSEIPPTECRGCGICVGECPARAIELPHYRNEQIKAAIDGLLGNGR